jgi:hypothetical protein
MERNQVSCRNPLLCGHEDRQGDRVSPLGTVRFWYKHLLLNCEEQTARRHSPTGCLIALYRVLHAFCFQSIRTCGSAATGTTFFQPFVTEQRQQILAEKPVQVTQLPHTGASNTATAHRCELPHTGASYRTPVQVTQLPHTGASDTPTAHRCK